MDNRTFDYPSILRQAQYTAGSGSEGGENSVT